MRIFRLGSLVVLWCVLISSGVSAQHIGHFLDSGLAPLPEPPAFYDPMASLDGGVEEDPISYVLIEPASRPRVAERVEKPRFQWGEAMRQSVRFLAVQHSFRLMTEKGTREELGGPFFKDYFNTIRQLRGWDDGDPFLVNYVGHTMMGAVSGYIQIQNDPEGVLQEIGANRKYVISRLKALGWATAYSTQFELGPLSEASIGNVGIRPTRKAKNPMAFVDLVITPTLGTALIVGEDALDKYVINRIERRTSNRFVRVLARGFLNPCRSFANMMRMKWMWYRDNRPL